jgi:hypothetical protein
MQARILRPMQPIRLPEVGKIKVGEKLEGEKFPRSLDYFRPTGEYAPHFWEAYGEKPNLLEIVFPSNDPRECCYERFELRDGPKRYAEGDGETFEAWSDKEEDYVTVTKTEYPKIMEMLSKKVGADWKPRLTLRFMLLKLRHVMGVWSLSSHAEASSIPEIISTFDMVSEKAGRVAGIPFDLSVQKVTSQKPGSKSSYPVIKLVPNLGVNQLEAVRQLGANVRGVLTAEHLENEIKALPEQASGEGK